MFCFGSALLCFLNSCSLCVLFVPCRTITLDNQLVVLATAATDAGRYHVEAVNELTGETVTSPAVYLSISGKNKEIKDFNYKKRVKFVFNNSANSPSGKRYAQY